MRTIVTGIIVFILWSALCTWYYVTRIKGPVAEEAAPVEQTAPEATAEQPEPAPAVIEPAVTVESPGSFTVHHAFDRSAVLPDGALDNYINELLAYESGSPDSKVNLTGHTDAMGPDDYNYRLGLSRAESTKNYLISKGIPAQKIDISSRGESQPLATNETGTGRAQNRRTEIEIVE